MTTELKRFTDIDPRREVALIATVKMEGRERQVGVARCVDVATSGEAEFAIVLSDAWQNRGLGTRLLKSLIAGAKNHGARRLIGSTLSDNIGMIALGRALGFKTAKQPGMATVTNMTLDLAPPPSGRSQ